MKYVVGILMILVGVLLVVKTEWFQQNFGSIAWAEEHMGTSGGSRLMYKLIGIAFIFFGMLVATDMIQSFVMGTIGKLFIR